MITITSEEYATAFKIVQQLLDDLRHSTWYDDHSAAYAELCKYREDMIGTVVKGLRR